MLRKLGESEERARRGLEKEIRWEVLVGFRVQSAAVNLHRDSSEKCDYKQRARSAGIALVERTLAKNARVSEF